MDINPKREKRKRETRPRDPRMERLMPHRKTSRSMEELLTVSTERAGTSVPKEEERPLPKEKEIQTKKVTYSILMMMTCKVGFSTNFRWRREREKRKRKY